MTTTSEVDTGRKVYGTYNRELFRGSVPGKDFSPFAGPRLKI